MSWFGTDLMALGCILGGAAVGGTLTAAILDGGDRADSRCGVEAFAMNETVTISGDTRGRMVVLKPDVRVHSVRDCVRDVEGIVEIHMDNHLEDLDLHMGHLDVQLGQLDKVLESKLHQMEIQLESGIEQRMEARLQLQEALRQVGEARVRVVLEKVEGGSI